jgi:hypothetical protein
MHTGITGSNPGLDMDVWIFLFSYIGNGLAAGSSLMQGVTRDMSELVTSQTRRVLICERLCNFY